MKERGEGWGEEGGGLGKEVERGMGEGGLGKEASKGLLGEGGGLG